MYPEGFQWDNNKNETNIEKHGIDFNDAAKIFEKPTLEELDDRKDYGEDRYNTIGQMNDGTCINVTYTDRDSDIRIISARCADKNEREAYFEIVKEHNSEIQPTQTETVENKEIPVSTQSTDQNQEGITEKKLTFAEDQEQSRDQAEVGKQQAKEGVPSSSEQTQDQPKKLVFSEDVDKSQDIGRDF
ncbi:BrnT family toxin [Methylomonas sp. AM2-LC]|uniref:BrnT family toxin n=1 Tax=Methylomonas sp. AM2-LC TaxID=3153301 RepID=UPI003264FA6A